MSDDGADFGATAEQGMKAALGGKQPEEVMDPVEFEKYIMSQTLEGATSYNTSAAYAAKLVLLNLRAHPENAVLEADGKYDWVVNSKGEKEFKKVEESLYDLVKSQFPEELEQIGLTGFQWGWAVNAARRCCELPPVRNPAIVTVG